MLGQAAHEIPAICQRRFFAQLKNLLWTKLGHPRDFECAIPVKEKQRLSIRESSLPMQQTRDPSLELVKILPPVIDASRTVQRTCLT